MTRYIIALLMFAGIMLALVMSFHTRDSYDSESYELQPTIPTHLEVLGLDSDYLPPALHIAAATGDLKQIRKLTKDKASLSETDRDGWTPLHWAAAKGQTEAVKLLLKRGADPNAHFPGLHDYVGTPSEVMEPDRHERDYKQTLQKPLWVALAKEQFVVAKILLEHGADTGKDEYHGRTPLMLMTYWGHPKSVQFLLENGASVTATDKDGWTALHWAAKSCEPECVEFLLQHGADPNASSISINHLFGQTHWDSWHYPEGVTALHVAVKAEEKPWIKQHPTTEQVQAVKALIAGGADPTIKDEEGFTPLDYAKKYWASDELVESIKTPVRN